MHALALLKYLQKTIGMYKQCVYYIEANGISSYQCIYINIRLALNMRLPSRVSISNYRMFLSVANWRRILLICLGQLYTVFQRFVPLGICFQEAYGHLVNVHHKHCMVL